MKFVTTAFQSIGLVGFGLVLTGCSDSHNGPGEFATSHSAQVTGSVLSVLRVPQESVGVSGRELRADAGYHFDVAFSGKDGRFVLTIDRIDASDPPEPDTLSIMLSLRAVGSTYPRAPDGSQLRDSLPVLVRFAKVGKAVPVTAIEAIFRGL